METEISHIKKDVNEIKKSNKENFEELKTLIQTNSIMEAQRFKELDNKYASKLVEKIVYGLAGTILSAVALAITYLVVK